MKNYLAGFVLGVAATAANAEVLVFDYVAAVQSVTTSYPPFDPVSLDSWNFHGVTVKPGDTLTGSFTIDTGTPLLYRDEDSGVQRSTYDFEPKRHTNMSTAQANGGGTLFASLATGYGARIHVTDAQPGKGTDSVYIIDSGYAESGRDYLSFNFKQAAGTMFTNSALDSLPHIFAADSGVVYYNLGDDSTGSSYAVTGLISSLTLRPISPVPEPSMYGMLLFGLATVGAVTRRRTSRAGAGGG
ncbi:PEP-CTERM sorting domain-containing protein [Massilia antarctica]|uniref:PEP-CTERM sorting domain-containing protein n=1 Tax=Massilia antarctica TaxID=2765360 RepID=UPI0006BB96FB|nr:PEP-CTERM sorting domain-containing protein [Massilia sp. H27-R4]MCY0912188.1 PEP-CTERM sorting domain-containing protein [Massilia sp. H27-R4]CUI06334.1 hypothetical protein BN2497_7445 [Janthinobacterium sp. CG23_2]CUU30120.1 hypothetical protein BN3177_7445 [Janthinobacterium sp. CG23_2]